MANLLILLIATLSITLTRGAAAVPPAKVRQSTYSYPITTDPSIFNEPPSAKVPATQLRGEVYWPEPASCNGPIPVIIMFSGKHPDCRAQVNVPGYGPYPWDSGAINANGSCPGNQTVVPGYRGFDYLGRMLAERGFGAISIDPALINNSPFQAKNDSTLDAARARLLLKTIEKLRDWSEHPAASTAALGFDISRTARLSKIGVVGHSRGGAAVRLAYNMLMTPQRLPVRESVDWKQQTQASIVSVMEVAPLFEPEEGGVLPSVVGAPWALIGAGCESDEINYEYFRLSDQQARVNPAPNFLFNVYGASHEYFNSEWHEAVDACLGDQRNTWNSAAPKYNITTPGGSVDIPLVLGSPTQQNALQKALLSFTNAYLGGSASSASFLRAAPGRSSVTLAGGVEIGLQNLNHGTANILQDFEDVGSITAPKTVQVETPSQHAKRQFPLLQSQFKQYGQPPFYKTLLQLPELPPIETSLATNFTYGNAAVLTLPPTGGSRTSVQIKLKSLDNKSCPHGQQSTIQVDLARRSNCLLPVLAAGGGKDCAQPRKLAVKLQVMGGTAITRPTQANLVSRFNLEWAPASLESGPSGIKAELALLPNAWETAVLQMSSTNPAPSANPTLELDFTSQSIGSGGVGAAFVYIGAVRQVCSSL